MDNAIHEKSRTGYVLVFIALIALVFVVNRLTNRKKSAAA